MPQQSPGVSELDARLAEIDRRLHDIQAGLAPEVDAEPEVPTPPLHAPDGRLPSDELPAPAAAELDASPVDAPVEQAAPVEHHPSPRSGPLATLLARTRRRRTEADEVEFARLVRMHSGLLDALGELVDLLRPAPGALQLAPAAGSTAVITAGPFGDTRQVDAFVASLAALEPVREAVLIGYEGTDRALIEVQLAGPNG